MTLRERPSGAARELLDQPLTVRRTKLRHTALP
jgi:hypothetical protein